MFLVFIIIRIYANAVGANEVGFPRISRTESVYVESSPRFMCLCFSVDMRERHRPEYADHWSDEKIIGGRAYYNFDQRSLVIEHVRTADEGFYKCRVDFKQSPTKNSEIKLIVVGEFNNCHTFGRDRVGGRIALPVYYTMKAQITCTFWCPNVGNR